MKQRRGLKSLVASSATLLLAVALVLPATPAAATTPGWVDTAYGTGGVTVVPGATFGVTIVDSTGRALVLGLTNTNGSGGQITRLTTAGNPDTSFGTGGTVTLPSTSSFYTRLAVDNSGLIYALGGNAPFGSTSTQFVVTRLTSAGVVDSMFGTSGTATVALPSGTPPFVSASMAVRPDGEIAVSLSTNDSTNQGYLAALTPAGALDTNINSAGTNPGFVPQPTKDFVFDLTTSPAPTAPTFTADTPPVNAFQNTPYSYTFAANGIPAPIFNVTMGTLPVGLTLTQAGVLSGTPTTQGQSTFVVTASNGVTPDANSPSITITVNPPLAPPAFTADTPPATAVVGTAYTYTFTASGEPAPTFSVSSGALPGGLTLDTNTGVLSGTPTTAGAFSFAVTAANGQTPNAVSPTITISVNAPPAFINRTPPKGNKGKQYSYTFTASGRPAPTFTVTTGSLPPGLTLSSAGVLSGVPTTGGTFTFTVQADNGIGSPAVTPTITLKIGTNPVAPKFTAQSPPSTATVGTAYGYTFVAIGNPTPKYSLLGIAPNGLTLDTTSGVLSGTPTKAGTFSFRVEAQNGVAPAAISNSIKIVVSASSAVAASPTGASPVVSASSAVAASPKGAGPVVSASPATASPDASQATLSQATLSQATLSQATLSQATLSQPAVLTAQAARVSQATPATVVTPDPNTVVAILANNNGPSRTYSLQRYLSNLTLDGSFGTGGTTAPFSGGVVPQYVAEAADASYYVTGKDGQSVFLAHFSPSGILDTSLGTAGLLLAPADACSPAGGALSFTDSVIYIIAVNTASNSSCQPSPGLVFRVKNAAFDSTFGSGGEVKVDSVGGMRVSGANGGGVQPNGKVLLGVNGSAAPAPFSAGVVRIGSSGATPTVESFTQTVDDSHFVALTVAPNASGNAYVGPIGATVDNGGGGHVYVRAASNNHLIEFNQTASGWSGAVDLTASASGPAIVTPPQAVWDGTNLNVFALASSGDLVQYIGKTTWTAKDINTAAGAGSPMVTSTISPLVIGGVARVYAMTTTGDLVEVDNDNANGHAWNFYDLSMVAGSGSGVASTPTPILISGKPHVYTRQASNNHLVEYVADGLNGHVWNAYDITTAAPGGIAIAGNPDAVLIGTVPHVYAAAGTNGDLVEFAADGVNGSIWNFYDQTTSGGAPKPVGNPHVVLTDGAPYGIGQQVPEVWETPASGDLTTFVADHLAGHTWNTYDVTALSGGPQVAGDPTPIMVPAPHNSMTVAVFAMGIGATGAAAPSMPSTSGLSVASPTVPPSGLVPLLNAK